MGGRSKLRLELSINHALESQSHLFRNVVVGSIVQRQLTIRVHEVAFFMVGVESVTDC